MNWIDLAVFFAAGIINSLVINRLYYKDFKNNLNELERRLKNIEDKTLR